MSREIYISGDIEADGKIPGRNSMMSFACVAFTLDKELISTIDYNLERLPGAIQDKDTMEFWARNPEAWVASTENPVDPKGAMIELRDWVQNLRNETKLKPIFVGYPASYDFMWIDWYLSYFTDERPLGFAALDMKSYAASYLKCNFSESAKRNYPKRWFDNIPHTHVAIDDALGQGAMAINIMREVLGLPAIDKHIDRRKQ